MFGFSLYKESLCTFMDDFRRHLLLNMIIKGESINNTIHLPNITSNAINNEILNKLIIVDGLKLVVNI